MVIFLSFFIHESFVDVALPTLLHQGKLAEEEDELNEMKKMKDNANGEIDSLLTKWDFLSRLPVKYPIN